MLFVDRLILGGVRFVLKRVSDAVEAELNDESVLRGRLLEAVEKLERGEISEEEYVLVESTVLDRLRAIREEREGASGVTGGALEFKATGGATVEASVLGLEGPSAPVVEPTAPGPGKKKKKKKARRGK